MLKCELAFPPWRAEKVADQGWRVNGAIAESPSTTPRSVGFGRQDNRIRILVEYANSLTGIHRGVL